MKNKKATISIKLSCRHCGNTSKDNSRILFKQIQYLEEQKLPWYAWNRWVDDALQIKEVKNLKLGSFLNIAKLQPNLSKLIKTNHFQWACDHCIDNNIAIEAKIEKQTFCNNPPYLAYVDIDKICQTCDSKFKFTKEEQKYWYEELKFWVQSTPKNCKECRKVIRKKNLNT